MATRLVSNSFEIGNIILQFESIKNGDFPFKRTSLGGTGLTYISRKVGFDWVVKWQSPALAEAEYICTVFYRKTFKHLSVPFMLYHLDPKLLEKLRMIFRKENILPSYVPLIMEFKQGVNFHNLYKERHIFQLEKGELIGLFRHLGEIAGYDFLIANFDRLSPVEFTGELNNRYSINGGNFLVEIIEDSLDQKKRVRVVHVIDNAPYLYKFFIADEKRGVVSLEEVSPIGLDRFEEEGDIKEEEPKLPRPVKNELSTNGNELRQARYAEFKLFLSANSNHIKLLAQQIFIGIQNEWRQIQEAYKTPGLHFFDEMKEQLEKSLAEGLLVAQERLKTLTVECIRELEQEPMTTDAAKIVISFMKLNLTSIIK